VEEIMSDYFGAVLSTSFRVNDESAFSADAEVQLMRDQANRCDGAYGGFFEKEADHWAFGWIDMWPDYIEGVDREWISLAGVIRRHIVDGDVCKIVVSGHEKLRYVGGPVWYVSSQQIVRVDSGATHDERLIIDDLQRVIEREYPEDDSASPWTDEQASPRDIQGKVSD
jgi:hypothetical protein